MRRLSLAIVLCTMTAAVGRADAPPPAAGMAARQAGQVHPAVVRIITPQRDGTIFGSGTLVATNPTQGLIVTNWHVVQNPAGPITVLFPDGFCSNATVLKADREWDLAALAVWRPHAEPVPIAGLAPRPGEPLLIAGYGSGAYRVVAGRCTQYVAPSPRHPYEMVELSARARQGDSGGPIFNARGELAGVLFGTGGGATVGSYCGRVRAFLGPMLDAPSPARGDSLLIARQPPQAARSPQSDATAVPSPRVELPAPPTVAAIASRAAVPSPRGELPTRQHIAAPGPKAESPAPPTVAAIAGRAAVPSAQAELSAGPAVDAAAQHHAATPGPVVVPSAWQWVGGTTRWEQLKSALALVGILAVLYGVLRLLSQFEPSQAGQTGLRRRSRPARRKAA